MKALSIKQPYAELILQGKKTIELRKWNTSFRGEFLVHASKTPDQEAMKKFNFSDLPLGFIIGKVNLADVKKYKNKIECLKDKDKHLAEYKWGNYGFILTTPIKLKPISCKGNLGFWDYNFPN